MEKSRVVLIGLDAADFSLLKPWINDGKLPALRSIITNGVSATLKSTIPPYTPSAWTSLVTGRNPGKHGIFDFFEAKDEEIKVINSRSRRAEAIWDVLSRNRKKVVVVNVPITFPPDEVNGIMISGFLTPSLESQWTYPQNLKNKIMDKGYKLFKYGSIYLVDPEDLKQSIQGMRNVVMWLMKKIKWDFLMVVLMQTDHVLHHFPKNEEFILEIYKLADELIDSIMRNISEDTYMIVLSDHGFKRTQYPLKTFLINNWLDEIGLAKTQNRNFFKLISKSKIVRRAIDLAIKVFPKKIFHRFNPASSFTGINISNSKAFSFYSYAGIRLNVAGRDPHGIIQPEKEYDLMIDYLIRKLFELRDPDNGEKIVRRVCRQRDIYWGPYTNTSPDLVIELNDLYRSSRVIDPFGRVISSPIGQKVYGDHDEYGIFMIRGPNIRREWLNSKVQAWDVAPTILHIMGCAIPADMDGRVLNEIFTSQWEIKIEKERKMRTQGAYALTAKEEEQIKERLKGLGYIG